MSDFLSIKKWAAEDRPREKLLAKGIEALSNAELIAILLGTGTKSETAVQLAKRVLQAVDNNLNTLGKKTIGELTKHKGIGEAKAISIIAAMELGRRRKLADIIENETITNPISAFSLFQPLLADLPHEEFWLLLLNTANKMIAKKRISTGGIKQTLVDIRLLVKHIIDNYAVKVMLIHNHPSGKLQPSDSDMKLTRQIEEACKIFDVAVIDHIIIGNDHESFFSFADNGLL